ncbi:uncharacterized protein N7459_004118 [Penicillium hispanicum]|uniref:uncharacterized protein n=1 Tax=Penicillium hispanicum TaxID=1080232 RepID=UPI0025425D37|nr:uncharacterized protein N7459_004118 [Penicillium hispanicum]KAJ5584318.1 hypothetical protein N7459_004118 [Penicillium hispanicum]
MPLPCISSGLRFARRPPISFLRSQQRTYNVAVLGGGITGLTAAWRLSEDPECSGITLYEKSPRLGGWVESETVPVDNGHVVFEYGPRTLRSAFPASVSMLEMAASLGLLHEVIMTPRSSPAGLNRFIYYPDRLVRLPSPQPDRSLRTNIMDVVRTLREPLFQGFVSGVIFEHTKPGRMPHEWAEDESVASFMSRRFNSQIADNLVSAMMHGIYAGDIDKLSAQALLGTLRDREDTGVVYSTLMRALSPKRSGAMDDFLAIKAHAKHEPAALSPTEPLSEFIRESIRRSTTFTFRKGNQQLLEGLASALRKSGKVDIRTSTEIQSLSRFQGSNSLNVKCAGSDSRDYDHAIAALPAPALAKILAPATHPNQLVPSQTIHKLQAHNYATTVMVVNLYYPSPKVVPVMGFGYLIPRSIPVEQNPEFGLGVIFASLSSNGFNGPSQDTHLSQDDAPGTKLTVMLGGHYWDGWKPADYPDHDSAVHMARTMLQRHLGITDVPTIARSRLQQNAIPQYTVGHLDRMHDLSATVRREFDRRLVLAGNWYNGVGVNDCIRQGILAATYGIGRQTVQRDHGKSTTYMGRSLEDWDLVGGIPTAPVRQMEF